MIIPLNDWIDSAQSAQGEAPAQTFEQLNSWLEGSLSPVTWQISSRRAATQGAAFVAELEPFQRFLHIKASASGRMLCARCLEPLVVQLTVDNELQVFQSERAADDAAMGDEADALPDPIVASRQFDVMAQIEEELLLELDLHDVHEPLCELPGNAVQGKTSPFAALAGLKK